MAAVPPPALEDRRAWLASLLANQTAMLGELAQVAGIAPAAGLAAEPWAHFARIAAFVDTTDFQAATEDARIWLLNRLGLYLARCFAARHGGRLTVQAEPSQRFHLHFVLTGMQPPVAADARLAPFVIAHDAINAVPRIGLAALVEAAEQALDAPSG